MVLTPQSHSFHCGTAPLCSQVCAVSIWGGLWVENTALWLQTAFRRASSLILISSLFFFQKFLQFSNLICTNSLPRLVGTWLQRLSEHNPAINTGVTGTVSIQTLPEPLQLVIQVTSFCKNGALSCKWCVERVHQLVLEGNVLFTAGFSFKPPQVRKNLVSMTLTENMSKSTASTVQKQVQTQTSKPTNGSQNRLELPLQYIPQNHKMS